MNFLDTLKKVKESKGFYKKKMKRKIWKDNFPIKYLWITERNMLVYSVGEGMSAPILMDIEDYLANDWEVLND